MKGKGQRGGEWCPSSIGITGGQAGSRAGGGNFSSGLTDHEKTVRPLGTRAR